MKATFFLFSFFVVSSLAQAQFQDDFDNGNFPNNPEWFGDTGIYQVNDVDELQLMDTVGGESFIYAAVNTADSTGWEFYFRMEFDPSTSNWLKVFLSSDSPDFDGPLNGYYLKIGSANDVDAIELYRQDNTGDFMVFSGTTGAVAVEPAVKVRVTRDHEGLWQLYADYSGGDNLVLDGSGTDNTYSTGSYFGFKCKYSPSRKDLFFFDNVLIGPTVLDEMPPTLLSATPLDASILMVVFNESLDQSSAENPANYSINNGISINNATIDSDPSKVILSISTLSSGQMYQLTTSGIKDLEQNISLEETADFTYFELENPDPFDILINEIFPKADTLITNLPDAEFFELFNRSDKAIDLEGFTIADAANSKTLPSYILAPQSYVIICNTNVVSAYSVFGPTLGVSGLFGLNDAGDDLSIADEMGTLIHSVSYNNDWYQDETKTGGGWSIELVNPGLYCQGEQNWRASVDSQGGTPGKENSVFDDSPDLLAPSILNAIPVSQNQIRLFFDELMGTSAGSIDGYNISNAGNIIQASLEAPDLNTVLLTIEAPFFMDQQSYTLSVETTVTDCFGNPVGTSNSFDFTYSTTQAADRYDILINELFPDPSPVIGLPETEFLELYNRSDKAINLEDFALSNGGNEVLLPFYLLLPGSFVILYGDTGPGFGAYGDTLVLQGNLGLSNEGGSLELLNPEGESIHAIQYDLSWYGDSSKKDGGWSLELINPNAPCSFASNWSASVNANGGTPGSLNSVLESGVDTESPDLIKAFPLSSILIGLTFSKALDEESASDPANYSIEGLNIIDVIPVPPFYNQVAVLLGSAIEEGQIYEVKVKSDLTDCIGNSVGLFNTARFAEPQEIEEQDLVINEVLVNPETGGVRFLELYNRSGKTVNVGELIIASRSLEDNLIEKPNPVDTDCLFFPGDYLVFTPSPTDIKARYIAENPNAFVTTSLPSYDDKEGSVVVYTPQILGVRIIDEFRYSQDLHNGLLDDKNGVSLERINPERATDDPGNWHSAAESVGFATPTYQNSQFFASFVPEEDLFELPATRLSPDGDGFEDFLLINYKRDAAGYLANIRIFDAKGRLIKTLTNIELLAAEGSFKWDGDTDEGNKARIGIYTIWIELFNPVGQVRHLKKTVVLAGILD